MIHKLTIKEKEAIRTLNFIAEFDGVISLEEDIKYLLRQGINKLIHENRHHLLSITQTAYPIRIKIHKQNK